MGNFMESVKSLGIYAFIIPGFILLYIVSIVLWKRNSKKKLAKWIEENPDYVKIYLTSSANMITTSSIYVNFLSDNMLKEVQYEGRKSVIYANPGTVCLELTFDYTRPGVMYRTVTTTYGPMRYELEVKKGKNYSLEFNKKESNFTLEEKN